MLYNIIWIIAVAKADIKLPEEVRITPATIAKMDPAAQGAAKREKRKPRNKASSNEAFLIFNDGAVIRAVMSLNGVNIAIPRPISNIPNVVTMFSRLRVNRGIINSLAKTPSKLYVMKLRVRPREKRMLATKALLLADFLAETYVKKVGRTGKRQGEKATTIPAK